jgi:FMN-dependent oxidoreductase (nitrilotriacetate monooxygenase family)
VKPLILGLFQTVTPNGTSGNSWRHPDNTTINYRDLSYWTSLARRAEAAKLDFIFLADSFGYPSLNGVVPEEAIRDADLSRSDPLVLVSALAAATERIGLVLTSATSFDLPYSNARRFATLDHFSNGRIGWNIVTGSSADTASALFGLDVTKHSDRYAVADDYVDLSLTLWEGAWEDGAVRADKEAGLYADASMVHPVEYDGPYFSCHGMFTVEPTPQRTPVLFQAGTSDRGKEFAARNAECVFLQGTTPQAVAGNVKDIRDRAEANGRDRDSIKILVGVTLLTDQDPEKAQLKADELAEYSSDVAGAVRFAFNTGINLLELDPDSTLEGMTSEVGQSNIDRYQATPDRPAATVREILAEFRTRGLRGLILSGTPEEVVGKMTAYVEETGIDGFMIESHISPGTHDDVFELLLPILRERGLFRQEYEESTLRERLFGAGQRHLREDHRGSSFRAGLKLSASVS